VSSRRNANAAKGRLMRKLLKDQGRSPRVMNHDKAAILRRSKARDHAGCMSHAPTKV